MKFKILLHPMMNHFTTKMLQKYLLILLVFLFDSSLAQSKVDEYARTDSDSESARIDNFISRLSEDSSMQGVIFVYGGDSWDAAESALRDIKGIEQYVLMRMGRQNALSNRISYCVTPRDPELFKELWLFPAEKRCGELRNDAIASEELSSISLKRISGLKTKTLYAAVCASCEPVVYSLARDFIDLERFAQILQANPSLSGRIEIVP